MSAPAITATRGRGPATTGRGSRGPSFPVLPQVNLLPPEIGSARALSRTKRLLVMALGGVLAVVVLAWLFASQVAQQAESDLAEANRTTSRLLEEQRTYAPVTQVIDQIERTKDARVLGMANEIDVAGYVGAVAATVPAGVTIAEVTWTGGSTMLLPPSPPNALSLPGAGVIVLTGRAPTVLDAVAWQEALEAIPGLRDAWIDTAVVAGTDTESYLEVTASVVVDHSALSRRFVETPQEATS